MGGGKIKISFDKFVTYKNSFHICGDKRFGLSHYSWAMSLLLNHKLLI